jgi:TatD DNase family protein
VSLSPKLPRLDCHAHIAPDVTTAQVVALGGAIVFAMTRSPAEAAVAARRNDETILWGYGAHPGLKSSVEQITKDKVQRAIDDHILIGEIGLDRATALGPQQAAFDAILDACAEKPVLLSIHSTGRTAEVVAALVRRPHPGAILHWFNGTAKQINQAVELGCYFSVNAAMTDERISMIPRDHLLPETDFPSSRRLTKAKIPGDVDHLEERIATTTGQTTAQVRAAWYRNLSRLVTTACVETRLPRGIVETLRTL